MKIIILIQLAADMQRFSRPERRINGPTITHLWSVIELLSGVFYFVFNHPSLIATRILFQEMFDKPSFIEKNVKFMQYSEVMLAIYALY